MWRSLRHRMKLLLQQVSGGEIEVVDVPAPKLLAGCVWVGVRTKVIVLNGKRLSPPLRTGADCPLPLAEIVITMRATFDLEESRFSGQPILVGGLQS